jgi:uncharacterized Fe-S cluster protein YjdI
MEKKIEKQYSNGDITVVWKPDVCIHSTICFKGLPTVFNPNNRPWVTIDGDNSEAIMKQVDKCPSGALSYFKNETPSNTVSEKETIVEVAKNGPVLIYGNIKIKDANGVETTRNKVTALCRCGASSNKPYCDGTHAKIGFEG